MSPIEQRLAKAGLMENPDVAKLVRILDAARTCRSKQVAYYKADIRERATLLGAAKAAEKALDKELSDAPTQEGLGL